jgi:carboxymethylenebutenolidase
MVKRLILIIVSGLVLLVGLFTGVMVTDAYFLDQSIDSINNHQGTGLVVEFPLADGTLTRAYRANPPDFETSGDPYPAMLMVHEWWGLNGEIADLADALAEQGYVVLAVDTYRGRLATTVPGALLLRITVPKDRVDQDMQTAFDWLAADPRIDPARIGVMGFCYGGGVALRLATLNPSVAATINLYGDTIEDPAGFGALLTSGRPLLGIFGELDAQIPVSDVRAFEDALAQTTIPHTVTIYPGVGHAFVTPTGIREPGAPQDAWTQILVFLADHLQGDS